MSPNFLILRKEGIDKGIFYLPLALTHIPPPPRPRRKMQTHFLFHLLFTAYHPLDPHSDKKNLFLNVSWVIDKEVFTIDPPPLFLSYFWLYVKFTTLLDWRGRKNDVKLCS